MGVGLGQPRKRAMVPTVTRSSTGPRMSRSTGPALRPPGRAEMTREQLVEMIRRAGLRTEFNELIKRRAWYRDKIRYLSGLVRDLNKNLQEAKYRCGLLAASLHPKAIRVCRRIGPLRRQRNRTRDLLAKVQRLLRAVEDRLAYLAAVLGIAYSPGR